MKRFNRSSLELKVKDANGENQPGAENRPFVRRRARNHAPQRQAQRQNPRPPQVLRPHDETNVSDAFVQQGMQRLYASYQQCVTRVAQVDERLAARAISTSNSTRCARSGTDSAKR